MPRRQLEGLIRRIVDQPDQVRVDVYEAPDATVFEAEVAPADLGKVIGRQGRTARAFRNLLEERGARDGERYEFEILDD